MGLEFQLCGYFRPMHEPRDTLHLCTINFTVRMAIIHQLLDTMKL